MSCFFCKNGETRLKTASTLCTSESSHLVVNYISAWGDRTGYYKATSVKRPPQWSRGNMVASHLAGLGSIPSQVNFPGWGFFWGFSSTIRQMSGKLGPQTSLEIIGHHNHKKIIHYERQWPEMLTCSKTKIKRSQWKLDEFCYHMAFNPAPYVF